MPTNKARHNSISKFSVLNSIKHSKNIFQPILITSAIYDRDDYDYDLYII